MPLAWEFRFAVWAYALVLAPAIIPSGLPHRVRRSRHVNLQLDTSEPRADSAQQLLFQDSKKSQTLRAEKEREMLRANTKELEEPSKRAKAYLGKKKRKGGGGGGFGEQAGPALSAAEQLHRRRMEVLDDDGVFFMPRVLGEDTVRALYDAVADELARAYANTNKDPANSVSHFNVPVETFDPLRGYLLLPLRDAVSVEAGVRDGPIVRALRELLAPGAPLGEIFSAACGDTNPDLYDLVALRTEAGAARQPIHSDTPWQKIPPLFCAFIALQDVSYEMGSTVFLPGTHRPNKRQRNDYDHGQFNGKRDKMLSKAQSRYTMLKAGDAAVFNMNTLHAGTANYAATEGGSQRLLFILTFRNRKAKEALGHLPNLRPHYRDRGITLEDMRTELAGDNPFGGVHQGDGLLFGDGLSVQPAPSDA